MLNNSRTYQSIVNETDKITPCIRFSKAPNTVYGPDDFHDMAIRATVTNSSVSGSASAMRKVLAGNYDPAKSTRRIPTDEWYRDVFSKMDGGAVASCIGGIISSQLDALRRIGMVPRNGMTVAIDAHLIPWYGKTRGTDIVRSKPKQGTGSFVRYVTVQCVDPGARLMLAAIHMPALESMPDFVRKLVDSCRNAGADVKMVLLDREFFSTEVMRTLDGMGVGYLTPCRNTGTVVDALEEFAAGRRGRVSEADITNADHVSVTYTMIITERTRRKKDSRDEPKNRYIGFATNVPDVDVEGYGKRWGIETGYKMLEAARPRTRSQNIAARNFCFMYAVVMFNAWVLANAMLATYPDIRGGQTNLITQTHFKFMVESVLILLSVIPPEPPPDPVAP